MPFAARVLRVMIASPSDMGKQRDIVEKTILQWNQDEGERREILLLPLRWERDATSRVFDGDAQQTITRQVVDRADIVIAMFHSRLGTETLRAVAGTAEELEEARQRGLVTHVLVSLAKLPPDIDPEQVAQLRSYLDDLKRVALVKEFKGNHELRDEVRRTLNRDVSDFIKYPDRFDDSARSASAATANDDAVARDAVLDDALVSDSNGDASDDLWSVEDLRRLASDNRVGAQRAAQIMDLLVTDVGKYFPAAKLRSALNLSRGEVSGGLASFSKIIGTDFPDSDGTWPFYYDWRKSTYDATRAYPWENHYYVTEDQAARWIEARNTAEPTN